MKFGRIRSAAAAVLAGVGALSASGEAQTPKSPEAGTSVAGRVLLKDYLRRNQKRDGANAALFKAEADGKIFSFDGKTAAHMEPLLKESKYNIVKIPETTSHYRVQGPIPPADIRLYVRKETQKVLNEICEGAMVSLTHQLPSGIQAIRPCVPTSLSRDKDLSAAEISAHKYLLGIDLSVRRYDVKINGEWVTNYPQDDRLLQKVQAAIFNEVKKLVAQQRVVPTRELRPPHIHITVMPDGYKPIPPLATRIAEALKKAPKPVGLNGGVMVPPARKQAPSVAPPVSAQHPPSLPGKVESAPARSMTPEDQKRIDMAVEIRMFLRRNVEGTQFVSKEAIDNYDVSEYKWSAKNAVDNNDYIAALVLQYRQLAQMENGVFKNAVPGGLAGAQQRIDEYKAKGFPGKK